MGHMVTRHEWRPGSNYQLPVTAFLNPAALRRTAAVMRNRCHVLDGAHIESGRSQRAYRRLASRTRTAYHHINAAHAVITGLLRGKRSALARPTEAQRAGALP